MTEIALGRLAYGDPLTITTEVDDLEIAALAGFIVAAAEAQVPAIIDGVIAVAAALVVCAFARQGKRLVGRDDVRRGSGRRTMTQK